MAEEYAFDWLNLLAGIDELAVVIEVMREKIPPEEKTARIREKMLALFLRHTRLAQKYYEHNPVDDAELHVRDSVLRAAGKTLSADLDMLKHYGLNYAMLVYLFDADENKIALIEEQGDTELPLDELIIKYGLAEGAYKAVTIALQLAEKEGDGKNEESNT